MAKEYLVEYCNRCKSFTHASGVCFKIHVNVREYPKKFSKKCNGIFFVNKETKKSHKVKPKLRSSKNEEFMKNGTPKYKCNSCGNVQKKGEHEKKLEDMARDLGIGSMIGAPSLACVKCGSQKLQRIED